MSSAPLSQHEYVVGVADEPLIDRDAYDGLVLMQVGLAKFLAANVDTHHGPAAQLNAHECYWPGCHVNVKNCQIDHLTPYSEALNRGGGLTNPHNAGVACGKHNRHKERGYTVERTADGTIEIRRPDDSILE